MLKTVIETSNCLLGIGYTSIIASQLLNEKGVDSIIIGLLNHKTFFDLRLTQGSISPVPIFPVTDSALYKTLKLAETFPEVIVDISYTEIKNCEPPNITFKSNSLAEFIHKDSSALKGFGLSLKQWGPAMLEKPFLEVQKKIKRHYLLGNKNSRVGYFDGFSIYYHFMKQTDPNILYFNSIEKIDQRNKIVFTDNFEIHFKKLISTIPVSHLLNICKINLTTPFIYEGSYFFYFSHISEFRANQIIYDCDLNSNILRVFSPTNNIIVAQIPAYMKGKIIPTDISLRLCEIIPTLKELNFEQELFLSMSYPIESITDSRILESIQMLRENSVVTFGRFGNWEYLDLHELNWNCIL